MSETIRRVAVLGAGQLGTGIAIVAARAGYQVSLLDKFESARFRSQEFIHNWAKKEHTKNRLDDVDKFMSYLAVSDLHSAMLGESDLVIEAVPEVLEVKQELLSFVSDVIHENKNCILASNTSSISITRLASVTRKPENFLGLHFMNPVPVMPLVEVIRGLETSEATLNRSMSFLQTLKKETAQSLDRPGFVANRLLMPYINEAVMTLQEGVASKEDIDKIMKLGTNVPMGPLALADFIGLDTCLSIIKTLHVELGDSKYRPASLLIQMVDAGRLGKKTGRGFYQY
jgi:3-hydroxybutyryl-CoA dehydrogenase